MKMITNSVVGWRVVLAAAAVVTAAVLTPAPVAAEEDGGFDVGSTFEAKAGGGKTQWHGYYEFHYIDKEGENKTYDAHKVTIWMGVKINDWVFLSTELEYEHFPKYESPDEGQGEIKLDSSQLSLTPWGPNYRGYLGVWYVPFGIEYHSYPGHKNKLISRPKIMKSGGIIPGTWSEAGLGFNAKLGNFAQFDVYHINGTAKKGGISRDTDDHGNDSKSLGARIMFDGLKGFNIGASYVSGKWDGIDKDHMERDDTGQVVRAHPDVLIGEQYNSTRMGAHVRADFDKMFNSPMAPVFIAEYVTGKDEQASSVAGKDKKVSGYYAQLSSRLSSLMEITARYDVYDNDEEEALNEKTETSVGLVFHVKEGFQIKAEYQIQSKEGSSDDTNTTNIEFVAFW